MDPLEFWKRWLEAGAKMWPLWPQGPGEDPERYADPFELFRAWARIAENARDHGRASTRPPGLPDPMELWQRWIELMAGAWGKAATGGADPAALTAQWLELLEKAGSSLPAGGALPMDPLALFQRWYEANSEAWAKAAEEMMGSEAFAQATNRFLDAYTSGFRAVRQASEQSLRNAQMPARADIARVAGLIVALEEKVDHIEEALDASLDSSHGRVAPAAAEAGAVERLEERLSRVESKLDRLITAVEQLSARERPAGAPAANGAQRPARRANPSQASAKANAKANGVRGGRRRAPGNDARPTA